MSSEKVGSPERFTQNRIIKLFRDQLHYTYLGNWEDRENNSNIEEELLRKYLSGKKKYKDVLINKAIEKLRTEANNYNRELYHNNKEVYKLLRYGVQVKANAGDKNETIELIDWKDWESNDFYVAEEVTVYGNREKRPDVVLYVNGIALAVLELKRSIVSIGDGIRQSRFNQRKEVIGSFFSTVQFVFAGSDTEGLRYGTIETDEKYFLRWKEDEDDNSTYKLDKYLSKVCRKQRFLEIIYDFVLFDGGTKKLPRHHQYFGIKAAQEHVRRREGGIIWHTQGSGKSLVMVQLAKWILENNSNARIAVITDRDELDKQIERVFTEAGEEIKRSRSGKVLLEQLSDTKPRMLCSLVHKFGKKDVEDFEAYIAELKNQPSNVAGELFVFVDECHRTQSGKLHKQMKARLPNAVFIGFTGTPLLKKDKATTMEVFGKYIHTYKFNEAVEDEVVLDLVYEARDIDQRLSSTEKVDEWFESTTEDLNDFQKSELKKKWGTMQKVLSSKNRMEKIVLDILHDFKKKPRLSTTFGNAILVAGSIYEACKYYELLQNTSLKNKCAVITSYNPSIKDVNQEDTGADTETEKEFIYKTYTALLNSKSTEAYEDEAKAKFIKEPARMKLLIVVDKLLTGFDAPPCTFLYIDKSMQDHGLFQAICRVNRLDGEDKDFGYIVDYKDLFKKVENAVAVYTSELDHETSSKDDPNILLQDRLKRGKEKLEAALEELHLLCEPVPMPKGKLEYIHYFCGNTEKPEDLKAREILRMALYKAVVALVRACSNIKDEMVDAGYTLTQAEDIKKKVDHYLNLREEIRIASSEKLDMKPFEADMRHLIDNYIQADDPRKISPFDDMSLLEIIVKSGIKDGIESMPKSMQGNRDAVAEAIENNVRSKIIKDHLIDPAYFEEMSQLLNQVIKERKAKAVSYEEYLKKIAEIAKRTYEGKKEGIPPTINTRGKQALYNNLDKNEELTMACDKAVKYSAKAKWKGDEAKEEEIKAALFKVLKDEELVEKVFAIIREQGEYLK